MRETASSIRVGTLTNEVQSYFVIAGIIRKPIFLVTFPHCNSVALTPIEKSEINERVTENQVVGNLQVCVTPIPPCLEESNPEEKGFLFR